MGTLAMRLALIAVLLVGCAQTAAPTGSPCPAALRAGFLVESDGELVTDPDGVPGGSVGRVIWQPWEYRVRAVGERLVVEDTSGNVIAREGDYVRLGGGMNATDDAFIVCGEFEVSVGPPSTP